MAQRIARYGAVDAKLVRLTSREIVALRRGESVRAYADRFGRTDDGILFYGVGANPDKEAYEETAIVSDNTIKRIKRGERVHYDFDGTHIVLQAFDAPQRARERGR